MILQKIKKSIEKIGIPCFLDYNDATSYCAVLIPETNGKESIKVDIQFIWEDGNPILLADEWIKSLRMNKELKAIVLGSGNNYAGYVLRVKVIDVSICSYIPVDDTPKYNISIDNDSSMGTVRGAGKYKEGKTCTISCTPFEQYYFDGWDRYIGGEGDVIYDNPYSFTVEEDVLFEATYGNKYHVEVVSAGNGTVSGSGYYEPTESCTITATPNTGYHFVNWTVNGLELTTDNPYTFIPTGDITITANFVPYYNISVLSSGNGSVSGGGTYNSGETVSLTATPDSGYRLVNWTEGGEEVSTSNPYTFTCTGNRTIVGNFDESIPLTINCSAPSSVVFTNSSNQTYELSLVAGENVYNGEEPGFAINEITGIKKGNNAATYDNVISFDAIGLTSWTTVENNAFSSCRALTTVILPNSITTIGERAFYYCSLTNLTLPNSLTSIGDRAFNNNNTLNSITCLSTTPPTLGNYAFDNTNNCPIYVPVDSVNDYKTAWSSYASRIAGDIPEPTEDNLFIECINTSSVILTNSSNQTYTWNLSVGRNYYTGTEPGFALNEITRLKKGSQETNILNINASKLTSWSIINQNDFNNFQNLRNITLPDTITKIDSNAFSSCNSLTSITLPASLTYLGYGCFGNCSKLESLYIPSNVSYIGGNYGTSNLTTITVDSNNTTFNDGNGSNCIIETSTNKLVWGCKTTTISNTIISIGNYAFSSCTSLTSITLPNSITSIGANAFNNCTGLTSINIPAGVSSIGSGAFSSCYNLTSLTVDSNNQYYNDGNGGNCIIETSTNTLIQGCTYTTIPNGIVKIGNSAFSGCNFTSITLPNTLTTIDQQAFNGCQKLTTLTIPANVNYIGHTAFWGVSLWYMEFEGTTPATLQTTSIFSSNYPFYVPSSAVSAYQTAWPTYASRIQAKPQPTSSDYLRVDLRNNNSEIILTNANNDTYTWTVSGSGIHYYEGDEPGFAINEITGLKSGNNGTSIGIIDASKLTSWTTIENDAFSYCQYLTLITLPASITSIGDGAFFYCNNGLTSINIPSNVSSIGQQAFIRCSSLTSITLPSTLTNLGRYAFGNCTSLTSITCLATTPPTLGDNAFDNTNNCPIYVPAASVNDYKTAQYWSDYASRIQPIP